jgi:hypothetical protein
LACGAWSGTTMGSAAETSTLSAGLGSASCAASALTAGTELVGSPGLNSMPEANHPAASKAIVPAIQYERRMVTLSLRQFKWHQSSAGKSSFRRSIGGQQLFSAQTWVRGRERFLCLLLAAVMDLQALHDLHQLFTLHQK